VIRATVPRRVVAAMLAMVFLTTLPYLVATTSAPAGTRFSGAILDPLDYNSHLAKMQQGARGEWLYRLLFTAEAHQPALLQTFYIALGHVARWTGLSFDLIYQLARIVFTALMVWALWTFMAHYLPLDTAWWALLLCLFGGGIGYLLFFVAPGMAVSPIEFWLLDAYTFLAAFISPHFAAGIALLAVAFLAVDNWTGQTVPRSLITLFLSSLAIAFIQPFDLLLLDVVLVAAAAQQVLCRRLVWTQAVAGVGLIGISHAAVLGYDWIVLSQYPVWRSFAAQNITLSPPPIYYLLGYAPTLLSAIGGVVVAIRCRDGRWFVPILWLVVVATLVYAPISTQRRFVLGVQAPMAALAAYWLSTAAAPLLHRTIKNRHRLVLTAYGALAVLSTIALIVWLTGATRDPANRDLYIPAETLAAWSWIDKQTPFESVILSGLVDGNNLTGRTGRRTVLGHWIETADYDLKSEDVRRFFSAATNDDWRLAFLQSQRVSYVWYGAEERALGDWSPSMAPYLRPVYETPPIVIYEVNRVKED
jgi:hypothetical protein